MDFIEAVPAAGADGVAPGLAFSQQAHLSLSESFRVMQSEHSHLADCCATSALNPESVGSADLLTAAIGVDPKEKPLFVGVSVFAPGLGVWQATHFVLS